MDARTTAEGFRNMVSHVCRLANVRNQLTPENQLLLDNWPRIHRQLEQLLFQTSASAAEAKCVSFVVS